jgi:hypothetical protein
VSNLSFLAPLAAAGALACSGEAPLYHDSVTEEAYHDGIEEEALELGQVSQAQHCGSAKLPIVNAFASSQETSSLGPQLAADGNFNTRWSSSFNDDQWLMLDLGSSLPDLERVVVHFEYASASAYIIETSPSGANWTVIHRETAGPVGPLAVDISGVDVHSTRYVRLVASDRATPWGVSVYEFEAYGGNCGDVRSITSVHSGRAVDVSGVSQNNGANIHQWTYGGGDNQRWEFVPQVVGGGFQLRALHSGKCLDIAGPSMANGANVHQWDCHSGASQVWTLTQVSGGEFQLQNSFSGKCLDVAEFSTQNGGNIHQWSCTGSNNQRWFFQAN